VQVENVEAVAGTLEELWLSYNSIEKLVSREACVEVSSSTRRFAFISRVGARLPAA
jgi:hypothetical protein